MEAEKKAADPVKEDKASEKAEGKRLVVVLVRGMVRMTARVKDTLKMLNLTRKNGCVVLENNPVNKGMVTKVKDFVTWGEIDDKTFKELVEKRGKESSAKNVLEVNGKKYKKQFNLNPPRKGFGRKGIKLAFKIGGALGYRGEKINDLLERMIK